ncbi:MAG TPA: acetate--CoA ligase family protein, partial [Actinomycetota bacterium]|nr:acetate--CoA ligase family protein [Actinomycetota bacterium]
PSASYRDGISLVVEHEPHLVVLSLDKFLAGTEPERAFVRAGVQAVEEPGAAVLMAFAGGEQADPSILRAAWDRGVAVTRGARDTLSALAGIDRWQRWRAEAPGDRGPGEVPAVDAETWTEHRAKVLLAEAGIAVTREEEVGTAEEAVRAAHRTGFPVVAKVVGAAHKTDRGGVRLGLSGDDDVRDAAAELLALSPRVLVAEQRRGDLELIVSGFRDEQFGPCGLVGLGGMWTEAFGQAVVVAGPATPARCAGRWRWRRGGRCCSTGPGGSASRSMTSPRWCFGSSTSSPGASSTPWR